MIHRLAQINSHMAEKLSPKDGGSIDRASLSNSEATALKSKRKSMNYNTWLQGGSIFNKEVYTKQLIIN